MQEGDDVTIPLLYFNHLYFLISSIHMCGCDNPNCPECRRTQNKNFDQRDIINLFRNTTFEDAFNIATNSNTMETYNKLRAELTNHSIDMLRPRAPPVSNAQILNTTLAEAAELSERKGRMREAGIQPPPSRMRDRHHHRTRYITLKEAHQIFGHTTSEEVIKATLTSGAVLGLALKPGSVSVDRFKCRGCTSGFRKRPTNYESTNENREKLLNTPMKDIAWGGASFDLSGPMAVESMSGKFKWLLPWVDLSGSGDLLIQGFRQKNEAHKGIKPFFQYLAKHGKAKNLKELVSDTDSCFTSKEFKKELKKQSKALLGHEVTHRTTVHKSMYNQKAETQIFNICRMANALLQEACYAETMWYDAAKATEGIFRSVLNPSHWHPDRRTKTPAEIVTDKRPNLIHLFAFGMTAYVVRDGSRYKHWKSRLKSGTYHYLRPDPSGLNVFLLFNLHKRRYERHTHVWIDTGSLDNRYNALLDLSEANAKNELSQRAKRVHKQLSHTLQLPPSEQPKEIFVLDDETTLVEVGQPQSSSPPEPPTGTDQSENDETDISEDEEGEDDDQSDSDDIYRSPGHIHHDDHHNYPDEIDENIEDQEPTEIQSLEPIQQLRKLKKRSDEELRHIHQIGAEREIGDVPRSESETELKLRRERITHLPRTRSKEIQNNIQEMEHLDPEDPDGDTSSESDNETSDRRNALRKNEDYEPQPPSATRRSPRDLSSKIHHLLPEQVIGTRIDKYDQQHPFGREGTVVGYDQATKHYRVDFEDDETEFMDIYEIEKAIDPDEPNLKTANSSSKASKLGSFLYPLQIIPQGDITFANEPIIAHQWNCLARTPLGVAKLLFDQYPTAFKFHNAIRLPGSVSITTVPQNETTVDIATLFGQWAPGVPSSNETMETRMTWFNECLQHLSQHMKAKDIKHVAMPYRIGCGKAGGKWDQYIRLLQSWAKSTEINVALYDKDLLFYRDQQHGLLPESDKVDSTSPADLERQRELEKWHEEEMNQQEASLHVAHQLASVDNSQTPSSHARYPTSALEEKDAGTHEAILRNARDAKFIIQHNPDLYYTSPTQGRDMWLDQIRSCNFPIHFIEKNPYPSNTKRWRAYENYKHSKDTYQAKRQGATRSYLRQDLSWGLFAIKDSLDVSLANISNLTRIASMDLDPAQITTDLGAQFTNGVISTTSHENVLKHVSWSATAGQDAHTNFTSDLNATQRAANMEDEVIETIMKRIDALSNVQSRNEPLFNTDLTENEINLLKEEALHAFETLAHDCFVPKNEKEARTSKEWLTSELEEIMELIQNGTFEVAKITDTGQRKPIACRMVYRAKSDSDGVLSRRKSRYCGKGFLQRKYTDYFESRSSVTEYMSVRTLMSVACQLNATLKTWDIKNAFVSAALPASEQLYLELPKNVDLLRSMSPELDSFLTIKGWTGPVVLKAVRSIYGLVQSPRRFSQKLTLKLLEMGFTQGIEDEMCFIHPGLNATQAITEATSFDAAPKTENPTKPSPTDLSGPPKQSSSSDGPFQQMVIVGWVDDLLTMSSDSRDDEWFSRKIQEEFTLSDGSGEDAELFLGMKVERDREKRLLKISCEKAINTLLHSLSNHLPPTRTFPTPISPDADLDRPTPNATVATTSTSDLPESLDRLREGERIIPEEEFPYRKVIGSVLHMSRTCRPDLALAISELSRHLGATTDRHVKAAKRMLLYLRKTPDLGIVWHGNLSPLDALRMDTYSDSDWAGNSANRKSRSGHTVQFGKASIDWFTKLQSIQSMSSCEAETIACCETLRTVLALRILLIELGLSQPGSSVIRVDNQALYLNASGEGQSSRSKHFALKTELLREYTRLGRIRLVKVHTSENVSDFLTKSLPEKDYIRLRDVLMGLVTEESRNMCKCLSNSTI